MNYTAVAVTDSEADEEFGGKVDEQYKFLFGIHMNLGYSTSNYAEYMGLIVAQLIHAMQGTRVATIKTDSQLLNNQVKGLAKVKNIRFTRLMPIIHDLALHFDTMFLDWIEREDN